MYKNKLNLSQVCPITSHDLTLLAKNSIETFAVIHNDGHCYQHKMLTDYSGRITCANSTVEVAQISSVMTAIEERLWI